MSLATYLKRAGIITGPLRKKTRHSSLGVLKSNILGEIVIFGFKAYNNFGSAVHEQFLLKKVGKYKLSKAEKQAIKGMLNALNSNAIVKRLMEKAVYEKRLQFEIEGVKMGGTPDIKQPHTLTVSDLKTTMCATLAAFIASAFKYGYYRQAVTYLKATGFKHYYIIGIQKTEPYNVYIILVTNDKDRFGYAAEELKFLLYFYKNYGEIKFLPR